MSSTRTLPVSPAPAAKAALAAGATMLAALAIAATDARAGDLVVRYDQSQLLRLPRQVSEVIIGNPSIADVSVQGGDLLVVTGKTFGITNIIAIDNERNVIQDQRVVVQRDDQRVVNLHKAGTRQSYTCTPNCSPMLTIGDDATYFDLVSKHASAKTKFSDDSTDNSAGGQQGSQ
jgi:hypothetical protein